MQFLNKKGFSLPVVILFSVLGFFVLFPTIRWFLNINTSLNATKLKLQLANLAVQKAKELDSLPIETIYAKIGTTDSETIAERYDIKVDYSEKKYDDEKEQYYVPITDKVNNDYNYSIEKNIYDTSSNYKNINAKYLVNDDFPSKKLAIEYNEENKEMSFLVDGKKVSNTEAYFSEGSGYINFTNGLIIQWGVSTGSNSIRFPIPFKHACFNALSTVSKSGAPSYVYSWNNSSMNIETYGNRVSWIALGY